MYWGRLVKIDTALYPISTQRNLAVASKNISMPLGCVFVSPIHRYTDTQKTVRRFFLFAAVLLHIRFVKFCKIGVLLARIPGYTQENDHFLSVYLFIGIHSTSSPSTWNSYSCVFEHLCEYADAKNCCFPIQNLPTAHSHSHITSLCFCRPLQLLRQWWQRDSVTSAAAWRRRGGGGGSAQRGGGAQHDNNSSVTSAAA
jgi:hypothetical protein